MDNETKNLILTAVKLAVVGLVIEYLFYVVFGYAGMVANSNLFDLIRWVILIVLFVWLVIYFKIKPGIKNTVIIAGLFTILEFLGVLPITARVTFMMGPLVAIIAYILLLVQSFVFDLVILYIVLSFAGRIGKPSQNAKKKSKAKKSKKRNR